MSDNTMEKDWDARAKQDAVLYVAGKYRGEAFFEEGTKQAHQLCDDFFKKQGFNPAGKRMLDIGCGIGRMERGFAGMFGEVWGLDVSGEMVARAKELNSSLGNVKFVKGNGSDLHTFPDGYFDFVFSYITFQHIPEKRIILDYFAEIHRVLKPGGLYKFLLREPWSGVALAFGFVPVPRAILAYVPRPVWKLYEKMARTNEEKLRRSSTYRGSAMSEKEARKALSRFSTLDIEKDPARVVYWCSGKK